jgi:hypothetical protein
MNVYRYLIALSACCGSSHTPVPTPPHELTLASCIGTGARWDPQGQSPELVGFGVFSEVGENKVLVKAQRAFGRIDRFDPTQIVLQDGARVKDFSISNSHELVGSVERNGAMVPVTPDEWVHAKFFGRLACPNPQIRGQVLPLWVEIEKRKDASPVNGTTVHGYTFRTDGLTTDLCADEGDVAIPFRGHWENDLNYNRESAFFSFMCVKRDLAKCVFIGNYALEAPAANQPDWLETCAHAMIADYCGDGQSFTKDKTKIVLWDTGHNAAPPEDPEYPFEAAWDEHGMVCHARMRWKLDEWERRGRFAPCVKAPTCSDENDAKTKFPSRPLLFTRSKVNNE